MPAISRSNIFILCGVLMLLTALPVIAAPSSQIKRLGYAIQMGAFSDIKNAERFTKKLQSKGIEAFYFRKDNGIYAVRFGDFPTKEKALKTANKLVADRLIDSYYIASPNEVVFSRPKEPGWEKSYPEEVQNHGRTPPQKSPAAAIPNPPAKPHVTIRIWAP